MKSFSQYIKESIDDVLSDLMDDISDYFSELKDNPFKKYKLDRSGYRDGIPFGDKKYAALVWEGDDADVLMLFEPVDAETGKITGILMKVTQADHYYRKFHYEAGYDMSFTLDNWKSRIKSYVERFLKQNF